MKGELLANTFSIVTRGFAGRLLMRINFVLYFTVTLMEGGGGGGGVED